MVFVDFRTSHSIFARKKVLQNHVFFEAMFATRWLHAPKRFPDAFRAFLALILEGAWAPLWPLWDASWAPWGVSWALQERP